MAGEVEPCSRGRQSLVPLPLTCNSPHGTPNLPGISGRGRSLGVPDKRCKGRTHQQLAKVKAKSQNLTNKKTTNAKSNRKSHVSSALTKILIRLQTNSGTCKTLPTRLHTLHTKHKALSGNNISIFNSIYVPLTMKTSFLLLLGCSHLKFIQTFVNEQ